jgi:ABC-2 type transport system permease protein
MSTFYFSSDIESLLPMPIKPSMILGSKFAVVLTYEYLTQLIFLLPIMITYGVMSGAGVLYYIYSVIVFLMLPIIPLVAAAFISIVVMRFTPFAKNKDAFTTVAGILGLFIGIGVNIVFQSLGPKMEDPNQIVELMMQGDNSLISTMTGIFPSTKLAVNALVFNAQTKGLINILLFIVVTIALLTLLLILGEALYFKGVIGISQASSKRRKLSKQEFEESTATSSSLKSYVVKELKILFRTPAYFMNCVLINFLLPVFIFIPVLTQPDILKDIDKLRGFLNAGNLPGYIIAIVFGAMMFISIANPTACTSISREGKNVFVCKYLPISYKKQILAKVISAILLNSIGLGLLIVVAMVALIPPVYLLVQMVVLSVVVTVFVSFGGVLVDLAFPKLQWDTEQRAVKQNINVLILMLIGFVIIGLTIFGIVYLKLNIWTAFAVLVALYGILDVVLYWVVSASGVKMFRKIQA